MTDSMIPYSFTPGTKAKASEVNANFVSLANNIAQNQTTVQNQISQLSSNKADKTELINEFVVDDLTVNLNDYKTKGTYIFSSDSTITNIPKGQSGVLIVTGIKNSDIKQIWFCDGENPEVLTRSYNNSAWSNWLSTLCQHTDTNPGVIKFASGLIIQYGYRTGNVITFPVAYTSFVSVNACKHGYSANWTTSDTGFTSVTLTGFTYSTSGAFEGMDWIAIGK